MTVLAIDPGTDQSAVVLYDGMVLHHAILPNLDLVEWLRNNASKADIAAVEWVESYGMAVGKSVFETVFWSGRFYEAMNQHRGLRLDDIQCVPRRPVKIHHCGHVRAKDSNVRVALLDRFGGSRQKACGTKAKPGPLYGITSHEWAALALAVYVWDTEQTK